MTNPMVQDEHDMTPRGEEAPEGGRARSCVGCGARVDRDQATTDMVRLIVSPSGEVVVDARGGGFGRGAWVHPRPDCLEKAVQRGLARSAKTRVHAVVTEPFQGAPGGLHPDTSGSAPRPASTDESPAPAPSVETAPLGVRSLALAIQHAMDRRIEGLVASAVRARRVALGADAVKDAYRTGGAELILVARDAAAAAELSEVRRAVTEGRAVAWGTKQRIAAIVFPGSSGRAGDGLGVVAILSRSMAGPLRDAVQTADTCAAIASGEGRAPKAGSRPRPDASEAGGISGRGKSDPQGGGHRRNAERSGSAGDRENSSATSACTLPAKGGELRPRQGGADPRSGRATHDRGPNRARVDEARSPATASARAGEPAGRRGSNEPNDGRSQTRPTSTKVEGPRSRALHERGRQGARGERGADGSTRGRRGDG